MRRRRTRIIKVIKFFDIVIFVFMALLGVALVWVFNLTGAEGAAEKAIKSVFEDPYIAQNIMGMELFMDGASDNAPLHEDGQAVAADADLPQPQPQDATLLDDEENDRAAAQNPVIDEDKAENRYFDPAVSESTLSDDDLKFIMSLKPVSPITISGEGASGYESYSDIYLKNETSYSVDIGNLMKTLPKVGFSSSGPQVLIIHTHGSEAYAPTSGSKYVPEDNDRTTDKNYNVVRVGDELANLLEKNGIKTVHLREMYDTPTYNGSYNRSLAAIEAQLKKTPSICMVIDLHRDAMIAKDGTKYKTVANIDGKKLAQIMFVVGTNEGGLKHDGWRDNLRLVTFLQKNLIEKYPSLMRPINIRQERFNQHETKGSMLIEVGTSGNTLDEALGSIKLFGQVLADSIKDLEKS